MDNHFISEAIRCIRSASHSTGESFQSPFTREPFVQELLNEWRNALRARNVFNSNVYCRLCVHLQYTIVYMPWAFLGYSSCIPILVSPIQEKRWWRLLIVGRAGNLNELICSHAYSNLCDFDDDELVAWCMVSSASLR